MLVFFLLSPFLFLRFPIREASLMDFQEISLNLLNDKPEAWQFFF